MQTLPPPRMETFRPPPPSNRKTGRRLKVFFGVLLISTLVGLAIVYGRDPVYRATASVLTVKPKAIDTRSAAADVEHVAIQGRLLLGETLLGRLSNELVELGIDLSGTELRTLLAVIPVPDTNLLELRAEGRDPEQLQTVINRWAEAYETFRAEEIEALSGRTIAEIEEQQTRLDGEIETARANLQSFRETHDIVSLERSENRSLSSLKGLNDSLNKARERLIEAEARQAAVAGALERGETVVPDTLKADMAKLRLSLQRQRLRLAGLRERFTDAYISADPSLRDLPAEVRTMERQLAEMRRIAEQTATDEAEQAVLSARASVAALEDELTVQQARVQQFTQRFKEFKALEEGLERLETLYADNDERLAKIRLQNNTEYPPIQVVDWARLPEVPIYPDYERDLLIALGIAIALALFVTWLVDYLSAHGRSDERATQLDVHIHTGTGPATLSADADRPRLGPGARPDDTGQSPPALPEHAEPARGDLPILPRELAASEVKGLVGCCDAETRGYAALLLNGVSPYELPLLHAGSFDDRTRQIAVTGANRRDISVSESLWRQFAPVRAQLEDAHAAMPVAELDQRLQRAADAAGIAESTQVTALALWHSYVLYLIRQGIDWGSLTHRVGTLPPDLTGALMHFAPPGASRPLSDIRFDYPSLADAD